MRSTFVDRGEVYGFLGLNRAGKTTTIRALLGMIRPSAGSVSLFGEPIGTGGVESRQFLWALYLQRGAIRRTN